MANAELAVIIPTLNGRKYLTESVRSVIQQDVNADVIVVRALGDEDAAIALSADEFERVRIVQADDSAPGAARSVGLLAVDSRWVYFHDHDDLVVPGAFAQLISLAHDHDLDIIGGKTFRVGETATTADLPELIPGHRPRLCTWRDVARDLATGSMSAPGAMSSIFRRDILSDNAWPSSYSIHAEMFFMISAFSRASRAAVISAPIRAYRIHAGQASRSLPAKMFRDEYADVLGVALKTEGLRRYRGLLERKLHMLDAWVAYEDGDRSQVAASALRAARCDPKVIGTLQWLAAATLPFRPHRGSL